MGNKHSRKSLARSGRLGDDEIIVSNSLSCDYYKDNNKVQRKLADRPVTVTPEIKLKESLELEERIKSAGPRGSPDFYSSRKYPKSKSSRLRSALGREYSESPDSNISFESKIERIKSAIYYVSVSPSESQYVQIIFDSLTDDFDTRTFNSRVCGKSNILLVVFHDEGQFGYYQKECVPLPYDLQQRKAKAETMFMFSFVSNMRLPLIIRRKAREKAGLTIFPNCEKEMILVVYSAFWLRRDGTVFFNRFAKDVYQVPNMSVNPFTSKNYQDTVHCTRLVALQCC